MAMEKPLLPTWKTEAKTLAEDYKAGGIIKPAIQDNLQIYETPMSVDMEEGKGDNQPYGIPIHAKLGIALIADFQAMLTKILEKVQSPELSALLDTGLSDNLIALLQRSSAITIDKNVLLKTLSQPGCEGVRFYLCKKVLDDAEGKQTAYASLVTVGVDGAGKDLHYEYKHGSLAEGLAVADVNTTSLVTEFSAPPPPRTTSAALENINDKLVLLQYAKEEATNIIKA